ncbi:uncharacterized protein F4822DRAFT_358625 [Hypoxylon trugodes]|uniref:uncharacterized protein n=1 Tax=Hypoxylon trugodes TaxID=326681 RepID=UPI00219BFB6C|nr:uncharacterized protein F4822DRAFT_358625 [Hypoxylon trugodes]KAI1385956.1 hypothetical protein F4822DRAFT_358625 [Hypoxylon trugodes]
MASPSEAQFHYFGLLPPEIRRKVYLLATPPRVVYVSEDGREDEDWDDRYEEFEEMCRTTPIQFKLHPDIAYFAHNWRPRLSESLKKYPQPRLESFGFTTSKKQYQPWVPTGDAPELPSDFLAENPEAAWAMTRSASLSSPAFIPPFLHVCTESREELQRFGYRLAFGTRTHKPRTWFHFEYDTLYLRRSYSFGPEWLSGARWDVDLFRPADLQRVKKLALWHGYDGIGERPREEMSSLLRLLPNLKNMFLVAREDPKPDQRYWEYSISDEASSLKGHYLCIGIDESDIIIRPPGRMIPEEPSLYAAMKSYKRNDRENTFGQSYFEFLTSIFEEQLRSHRAEIISEPWDAPIPKWNVPNVELAHLCSLETIDEIFDLRRRFWGNFIETRKRLARGKRIKSKALKEKVATSSDFQDVGEAYLRAHEPDQHERWEFYRYHHWMEDYYALYDFTLPVTREELWWLTEAHVSPPRFDVF